MKIKIENFGPIHSFEMDLDKDMHILYGENNVGKSYAISMVFLILRKLKPYHESNPEGVTQFEVAGLPSRPQQMQLGDLDVTETINRALKESLSRLFIPSLANALINTRGGADRWENRYNSSKLAIELIFENLKIEIHIDKNRLVVGEIVFRKKYILRTVKEGLEKENHIALAWDYEPDEAPYLWVEKNQLLPFEELGTAAEYDSFYLPATRSGVYSGLGGLSSIFAKLSQIRHLLQGERIDLPSLPEPTSDFFLKAASIDGEPKDGLLKEIYSQMERELIKGEVRFNSFTKRIQFYQPDIDMLFELEQTSSMVAELSILIAFLKFIIHHPRPVQSKVEGFNFSELYKNTPMLFIEEPEAHLHPEIQVKLTEYLVEVSRLGVKVITTTHSNYLFNKASNMILKGELQEEKVANYHMIMTDKGSIVNPKDTLHDWGMEDENFVAVAQELYQERLTATEQD